MHDLYLRGIDEVMADRIKTVARERDVSLNEAVLELLRSALGMSSASLRAWPGDVCLLAGTWGPDETRAFREATSALEDVELEALLTNKRPKQKRSGKG